MNPSTVFAKTGRGSAEMSGTDRTLDRKLRSALLLVDGRKTAAEIIKMLEGMGMPADTLGKLEQLGYIAAAGPAAAPPRAAPAVSPSPAPAPSRPAAPVPAAPALPADASPMERFSEGRRYMNTTVRDALGFKAVFFTLKIEKCSTVDELLTLLPDFQAALATSRGAEFAQAVRDAALKILAP